MGFRRLVDSSLESGKQRWTLPERAGRYSGGRNAPRWIRLARKGELGCFEWGCCRSGHTRWGEILRKIRLAGVRPPYDSLILKLGRPVFQSF